MITREDCERVMSKLKMEFWLALNEGAEEAAEYRMSEYDYVHDFLHVEEHMDEAIEFTDIDALQQCGLNKELAMDFLEGYWNKLYRDGKLEKFSKEVDEL